MAQTISEAPVLLSRGSLWMGTHSINLVSPEEDTIDHRVLNDSSAFGIPGWQYQPNPSDTNFTLVYIPDQKPSINLDLTNSSVEVRGRTEDYENGQALAYIAFWFLELQRQKDATYVMHSSAVSIDGRGALILGHSGAGKTSVLLKLCEMGGCEVVSNDLTVVRRDMLTNQMFLDDGTKEIRLRFTAVQNNFPELKRLFTCRNNPGWEEKVVVSPEDIGGRTSRGPKNLARIFEVHHDSRGVDDLVIKQERGIGIRYRLYEDMSRIIRGSAISVFSGDEKFLGYMPSLDSKEIHDQRVKTIEHMTDTVGITSVSGGDLNEIARSIRVLLLN